MSYARFSNADVYVFLASDGHLECCFCWLNDGRSQRFPLTADIVAHLRQHQHAGHNVPDFTFTDLEADREENDAWIAAGGPR